MLYELNKNQLSGFAVFTTSFWIQEFSLGFFYYALTNNIGCVFALAEVYSPSQCSCIQTDITQSMKKVTRAKITM